VSLAGEVLSRWAPIIRAVELVSGSNGRFEVALDGDLVFSKKAVGRFPKPGEVAGHFEKKLGPALDWRASPHL
jgi:selT/selW/selH-like putative selenoprotein